MKIIQKVVVAFVLGLLVTMPSLARNPAPDPNAIFPVELLKVVTRSGEFHFTVEVADDDRERTQGLMHRKEMAPTHGMLFDFGTTRRVDMWMRNTLLPLDMIFVNPDGTVARVATDAVPGSLRVITSGEPVSHVLEVNAGIARMINLKPGDKLIHRFFE